MILVLIILFLYVLLISAFVIGFYRVEDFKLNNTKPIHTFSVIVAFRNEVENLPRLLASLVQLKYPINMFEIVLVNDDSSDNFMSIIEVFQQNNSMVEIKIINSEGKSSSPKKEAISKGIYAAKYDYIVTTDADCVVPENWLKGFNQLIEQQKVDFIAGAVIFNNKSSFLHQFQQLNLASLIGSTIGSFGLKQPIMCNGANLCYSKAIFKQLNGFKGNEAIASGDDVFLLEKMQEHFPDKISYLKSADLMVETNSESTWNSFLNQQLRWASKTTAYKNKWTKSVGALVFLTNVSLLGLFFMSLLEPKYQTVLIVFFIVKSLSDGLLLVKTMTYFNRKISASNYMITLLAHPFFIVGIAFLSLFKGYRWKNRRFNH